MRTKNNTIFYWIMVMGGLFCTYPFVFNLILPLPSITLIMILSFGAFAFLFITRKAKLYKPLLPLMFLQILGTIVSLFVLGDWGYGKQMLYILWGVIVVSFIKEIGFKHFLYYYNRFILVIACLGTLSFLLSMLFGSMSFLEFTQNDGRDGWLIYFTFTNTTIGDRIIRYAGVFDEPGAMASWGMFSLLLNKVYVKDRKLEVPLIICLLFTLSLAYIIQLSMYLYFFYINRGTLKKKILVLLTVVIGISLFIIFVDKDSPIYMLTLGRLGIGTSVNFLEDNNRAGMMEIAKKMFQSSPLFGVGTTAFYAGDYAADNPYETLAKDGIIGTLFLYLPLLMALKYTRKNKEILYMIIILAVGYLQRPFHINILHYTMIYLVLISAIQIAKMSKVKSYEI